MSNEINIRGLIRRDDLTDIVDESPFTELTLVAEKVLPSAPVKTAAGVIPVRPVGNGKKAQDTTRAEGAAFNRGSWSLKERAYISRVAGWEEGYDTISETENAGLINLDMDNENAIIARNTVLISREQRVANSVYDTSLFTGAGYNLSPTNKWNSATGDIRKDALLGAKAIKSRLGIKQSRLSFLLSEDAITEILQQTAIRESVKYLGNQNGVSIDLLDSQQRLDFLAQYLRVGEIVEVSSFADISDLGIETPSFEDLWNPDFAMLAYLTKAGSLRSPGLGVQPVFTPYAADIRIDEYEETKTSQRLIRASEHRGETINKDFGFLFTDILS